MSIYEDNQALKHGFKNEKDVKYKIRKIILSLIQLKQDFNGISGISKYQRIKSLCSIYPQILNVKLQCACCGEFHEEFLTIDHVNNDGAEKKNKSGLHGASSNFKRMLYYGFKTSDYQILCYNCNCSLGHKGYCPHRPEVKREVKCNRSHSNKVLLQKEK